MRGTLSLKDIESNGHDVADVLSWQTRLRQAMYDAVSEDDVKAIVKAQVDAAKKGDKAAKFLMDYVLASKQPVTLVQNNHYGVEEAARAAAKRNGRRV